MFSRTKIRNILLTATAISLLSGCSLFNNSNSDSKPFWESFRDGSSQAQKATVAYSQGNFDVSEKFVIEALQINPKQPQALMVGGMLSEQIGRQNRARQSYEDLIVLNGDEITILGSTTGNPVKMS